MYSSDHISVFTSQSHVFLGRYARRSWLATQDLYPTPFPTLFSVAGTHKRAHKAGHAFKASTELGVAIWLSSGQRDWEHFRETSGKWFPPNDMIWVSQESSLTPLSTPLPPMDITTRNYTQSSGRSFATMQRKVREFQIF